MAYAILHPVAADKGGRGVKKTSPPTGEVFGKELLRQARAVLKHALTLVEKVRDGFPLNEAYEVAMTAKNAPP
jgi:hypothetical protein